MAERQHAEPRVSLQFPLIGKRKPLCDITELLAHVNTADGQTSGSPKDSGSSSETAVGLPLVDQTPEHTTTQMGTLANMAAAKCRDVGRETTT